MKFTKMHGLGNDFVIVHGEQELPANVSELAIAVCDRHFGIGADGLVYILPSQSADVMMRIINSDGTEAEQCGNAIRCVSTYVVAHGFVNRDELTIETRAGIQRVQIIRQDGSVHAVRVDMGEPVLDGLRVPTIFDEATIVDKPIEAGGHAFSFTAVSMGNPHCVIFVDDAATFDIHAWGPLLESHSYFPRNINVEFASIDTRDHVTMRVWERGAGPTLACGTGACATLVSSVLNGLTDRAATVSLAGGDLFIEWNPADNHVYMTGPATFVFEGEWK
ncbi:diaminopimelate epimerase [Paenibacillus sp. S-12]|uniref:diaminopimelate epimerase n=1 Tax=Paenibacillus sp. S-12 TaxID=3031371 RepID=UPI0025A26C10|nr:diaminopimelate epimerase [Paenibacillus sp. S-12]